VLDPNSPENIENLPLLTDVVVPGDPEVIEASKMQALETGQSEALDAGVEAASVPPANIDTAAIGTLVDRILERRLPQLRAELISEVSQALASEESPAPQSDP
jgi:hypothetical protein